jgi:hypothetical protein
MIRIMRDPQVEHPWRDEMAKAAAPYVHARLAATDVNAEVGVGRRSTASGENILSTDLKFILGH